MSTETVQDYIEPLADLEEAYRKVYPEDELNLEVSEDSEYDFVITNDRTDDIRFSRNLDFSERSIEELHEGGEPNIRKLNDMYQSKAQDRQTRVVELNPELKNIDEEQENLWYAFTECVKDPMNPDEFLRTNGCDCLYMFDLSE